MAPSLLSQLKTARDRDGVAPDANDRVLMLVAQSRSDDPAELAALLAEKGLALEPSSITALAAVIRAHGASAPAENGTAGADSNPMSFLQRIDDQPGGLPPAQPAPEVVPGAPVLSPAPAPAAPSPSPLSPPTTPVTGDAPIPAARRRNRRGLSPAHDAQLAAREQYAAPVEPDVPPAPPVSPPPPVLPQQLVEEPAAAPAAPVDIADFSDSVDVWSARENSVELRRAPDGTIHLAWPPHDPQGRALAYLVVGSDSTIPVRPSGGTRLVITQTPRAQVPPGSGPYFSVFTYEASSAAGVPSADPVHHAAGRLVPEVSNLRISTHPDAVVLTWTAPSGVDRVRVMRGREGQSLPAGFDASLEIEAGSGHARDTDVLPGRMYEYRVLTQFVSSSGHVTLSSGTEVSTEIPATPDPVVGLTAEVTGEPPMARVDLRWPTPSLGRVVVYQTATVPVHAATNKVITAAQLDALPLGEPVGEPSIEDGGATVITGLPFSLQTGPRRAFTPVTIIGSQAAVGPAAVVNLLGSVTELELVERVDWQLLRFAWPAGATFAFVHRGTVEGGPDGTAPIRVSREDYDRQGGMRLQLPMTGCELFVQGAVIYAGSWTTGPVASVTYPGRWVLRYRYDRVGLMGRRTSLQIRVDRPWREVRLALVFRQDRLPLSYYDYTEQPRALQVDGSLVTPGEWYPVEELPVRTDGYTRLFAYLEDASPIVIDPPAPVLPREPVQDPVGPGQVRCVRCMTTQPEVPQLFRCTGRCPTRPDPQRSTFLGTEVVDRPVFPAGSGRVHTAPCPTCHVPSDEQVCKSCHAALPPNSATTDPVSLTVVGARGTGKTTYLLSLIAFLEKVWGPETGASAVPMEAATEGRLARLRESLDQGRTVGSTVRAEANRDVLAPMLLRLDQQGGRERALALYDVSGEDVENPRTVGAYGPTLATTDALLFLIDPLQLPAVRNLLEGQIPLPPVAGNPLTVLQNVIGEIRSRTGVTRIDVPVAVAVSKLDGIHAAVRTPGTDLTDLLNGGSALMYDRVPAGTLRLDGSDRRQTHEETRSLLLWLRATQFVTAVESAFSRVEYFALSALGHAPAGGETLSAAGISAFRVADPVRWVLDRRWPDGR